MFIPARSILGACGAVASSRVIGHHYTIIMAIMSLFTSIPISETIKFSQTNYPTVFILTLEAIKTESSSYLFSKDSLLASTHPPMSVWK